MKSKHQVLDRKITTVPNKGIDYLCLTDIARGQDPEQVDLIIGNWLSDRNTIEFLGLWETLNNPDFNVPAFDGIKAQAGLSSFLMTPTQWIADTGAIGLIIKSGCHGPACYGREEIACEFACWLSVAFKFYFIKELQRLDGQASRSLRHLEFMFDQVKSLELNTDWREMEK